MDFLHKLFSPSSDIHDMFYLQFYGSGLPIDQRAVLEPRVCALAMKEV